jgi:hypothetical protein
MINKILAWAVLIISVLVSIFALTSEFEPSGKFVVEILYFAATAYVAFRYLEALSDND